MPTVTIRSLLGRVGSVLLVIGGLAVVTAVLRSDGVAGLFPLLGWGTLAGLAVWALWWAPMIVLEDECLRIRNAWRTHEVSWEQVVGCSTRWSLVVRLRDGRGVTAAAAQRSGGLTTSWRRRQELREREMSTGRTEGGSAVSEALSHRGVRQEYLSPGEGRFRTSLDADGAGDLIEAYAERRAVHERVRAHERGRRQRLARRDQDGPAQHTSRPGAQTRRGDVAEPARGHAHQAVESSLNIVPVVVGAAGAVLVCASFL